MATVWYNWIGSSSCTTNDCQYHGRLDDVDHGEQHRHDRRLWYTWANTTSAGNTITVTPYRARELSAEEKAEQKRRNDEWAAAAREKARLAEEARVRAEALLNEGLTPLQRAQLEAHRYFTVEAESRRRYRIHAGKGKHGNIEEIDERDQPVRRLCCAPVGEIPEADALLAQKLYLEHAEEEFRRTANFTELRRA